MRPLKKYESYLYAENTTSVYTRSAAILTDA